MNNNRHSSHKPSHQQGLSLVLTVLNEASSIRDVLHNLLRQTRPPDEIVIVDGGSKDKTVSIINEVLKSERTLRLIVKSGVNISQGRNIAIKSASYPLIVTTDGGCRPAETWLEKLVHPFQKDPSTDVVKGLVKPDPQNLFESLNGLFLSGYLRDMNDDDYPLSGRTSAFKKRVWEKAGGYPEWLYTAEDTLFHRRLKSMGLKITFARDAFVYWRPRDSFWKMAKMCYLYGRGNGRINDDITGATYNLRNYTIQACLLLSSFFFHYVFFIFFIIAVYFYFEMHRPIINRLKRYIGSWKVELLAPLVISMRKLSTTIGLLVGYLEYKFKPGFKENLNTYMTNS